MVSISADELKDIQKNTKLEQLFAEAFFNYKNAVKIDRSSYNVAIWEYKMKNMTMEWFYGDCKNGAYLRFYNMPKHMKNRLQARFLNTFENRCFSFEKHSFLKRSISHLTL